MSKRILRSLACAGMFCALFGIILARQSYAAEQNGSFDFNVTVNKTLEVSVKGDDGEYKPDVTTASATGGIGQFLRTSFTLKVSTNNANGYTATMTTDEEKTTDLINESDANYIVPTLARAVTKSNFTINNWGFSLDDTRNGDDNSTYRPVVLSTSSTPSTIAKYNKPVANSTQEVYFGMMADSTKMAGNYSNTVVLTVVTNPEPIEEEDIPEEEKPSVPTTVASVPSRFAASAPAEEEEEDNTPSGVKPKGVIEDTTSERNEKIIDSSKVGAGIALGATTVAASGVIFFVVAKRREDDDEEEE